MVTDTELTLLIERLKSDASDYEGVNHGSHGLYEYLQELLDSENLQHEAAIGSAKRAINEDISSLSTAQLKSLALDMLINDTYIQECPNDGNIIAWSDMTT
ncbi:hypothetical protein COI63_09100 [Bacillus toyonensis]|uniref:hypothetical protein n=1 Tax=Bacillus toyonensis TaxID=155322 RepID=UPI000BFC7B61|nr:hypothetical protein [Bacillus toyonensis]PHG14139.1 hypothetical protein COI63_09100 [Bacillus toyonensis]